MPKEATYATHAAVIPSFAETSYPLLFPTLPIR